MPAIDVDRAQQAVSAAARNGAVRAAGSTSTGRPTPIVFTLETAALIIERATQLEWVEADNDGYHLWVITPGGRTYRLDAIDPDGPPRQTN